MFETLLFLRRILYLSSLFIFLYLNIWTCSILFCFVRLWLSVLSQFSFFPSLQIKEWRAFPSTQSQSDLALETACSQRQSAIPQETQSVAFIHPSISLSLQRCSCFTWLLRSTLNCTATNRVARCWAASSAEQAHYPATPSPLHTSPCPTNRLSVKPCGSQFTLRSSQINNIIRLWKTILPRWDFHSD